MPNLITRRSYMWIALLLLLFAGGCGGAGAPGRPLYNQAPFAAGTGEKSLRVISLSPAATETICDLRAGDMLVGVTDNDDYPEFVRKIPSVGDMNPNLEIIAALEPDVIFYDEGLLSAEAQSRLKRLRFRSVPIKQNSVQDIRRNLLFIAEVLNLPEQGRRAAAEFDRRMERLRLNKCELERKELKLFLVIWPNPLTTASGGSFVGELIGLAGARSCYSEAGLQDYPVVSMEDLLKRDPDLIVLVMDSPFDASRAGGWPSLRAVRSGCVFDIPGSLLFRPTLRCLDGVEKMQECCRQCLEKRRNTPEAAF